MKKIKMLSLLTAAMICVSCLPVSALAESAPAYETPLNAELLSDTLTASNWSGLAVSSKSEDAYLKWSNPSKHDQTGAIKLNNFNMETGKTYVLTLKTSSQQCEGANMYRYWHVTNKAGTASANKYGDLYHSTPTDKLLDISVTEAMDFVQVYIRGANNACDIVPFNIHSVTVTEKNNVSNTKTWDFESFSDKPAQWDWFTPGGKSVTTSWVGAYDYIRVAAIAKNGTVANTDYNQSAKLNPDVVLTPGKYSLTFDARQSYFFYNYDHNLEELAAYKGTANQKGIVAQAAFSGWSTATSTTAVTGWTSTAVSADAIVDGNVYHALFNNSVYAHVNNRDVKLVLADGTNGILNTTFNVTTDWNSYTYTFDVPKGKNYTLNNLSFGGTGLAYDNDAFDIANLSLKLVDRFDDADNYLEGAVKTLEDAEMSEMAADSKTDGGYVTVGRRPWYFKSNKYEARTQIFNIWINEDYDASKYYFVSFKARHSVETNNGLRFQAKLITDQGEITSAGSGISLEDNTTKWNNNVKFVFDPASGKTADKIALYVRVTNATRDIPLDIDDLVIWQGSSSTESPNAQNILYSEDFNDPDNAYFSSETEGKLYNIGNASLSINEDAAFTRLSIAQNKNTGSVEYSRLTDIEGNAPSAGVYTFNADIRVPYFFNSELTSSTQNDSLLEPFYAKNAHKATVTFVLSDGDSSTSDETIEFVSDIGPHFTNINESIIISEGYTLTAVKIAPVFSAAFGDNACPLSIDLKNVYLSKEDFGVIETDDNKNYLDSATAVPDSNTVPSYVEVDEKDGELYISERENFEDIPNNFFKIFVEHNAVAGRQYFISYEITADSNLRIRPKVNLVTRTENYGAGNLDNVVTGFVNEVKGESDLISVYYKNNAGAEWLYNQLEAGVTYKFKGEFTPVESSTDLLRITLDHGATSEKTSALTIDDLRIWYVENGEEIEVYSNNFDGEDYLDCIYGNNYINAKYSFTQRFGLSHNLYTPIDSTKPMSVTYELNVDEMAGLEGKYNFIALARLSGNTDKVSKAIVTFKFDDGSTSVNYIDITDEWANIGIQDRVGRGAKITSITVTFDTDVAVELTKPVLTFKYRWEHGRPNTGIVMMLLKKLNGKFNDPWRDIGLG